MHIIFSSGRIGPVVGLVPVVWLLAGCYSYVPVQPGTPGPGSFVRVEVNDQGASKLTSVLGPGVLQLNGLVLAQEDQTISMLVNTYQTTRNAELTGINDPVRLSIEQIRHVEQKQMSRARSLLLGAAVLGGGLALTHIFAGDDRVLEPEDPDDPGPIQRRPLPRGGRALFQIRFP